MNWLGELNVRCSNLNGAQVAGVTVLWAFLEVRESSTDGLRTNLVDD
jgi:hypothetical protein